MRHTKTTLSLLLLVSWLTGSDQETYTERIDEETGIKMIPVEGGEFLMGSSPEDPWHQEDEAPARRVRVSPFWMSETEITWDQYELFMYADGIGEFSDRFDQSQADAVTVPSRTVFDPGHGMERGQTPAVSMTHYAALAFTRWLSLKTGHFYRLPTEAEWEYACRAGTRSAWHFGNEPEDLDRYGWHYGNSGYSYQETASKEPNPWGFFDMHGNVAEWTLDQYEADFYASSGSEGVEDPWSEPTDIAPRTLRGGSWNHDPEQLRCAERIPEDPSRLKRDDPQIPKSLWWNTNGSFIGFRIVRPVEQPSVEEMEAFWQENLDQFYYE